MANLYFSDYVIEGKKEELDELEAMLHRLEEMRPKDYPIPVDTAWESRWNGFLIYALGEWPEDFEGARGEWYCPKRLDEEALAISFETVWDDPDCITGLMNKKWPSLKFCFFRCQPDSRVYEKIDPEGKYFPFDYILVGCVPKPGSEGFDVENFMYVEKRFNTEQEALQWVTSELSHPVGRRQDIQKWNFELNAVDTMLGIALHKIRSPWDFSMDLLDDEMFLEQDDSHTR